MTEPCEPSTVEECVEAFLGLAMLPPETPPKQQYRQRENRAQIIGYAQAQRQLRLILKNAGFEELAEIRNPKSPEPMEQAGLSLWVL